MVFLFVCMVQLVSESWLTAHSSIVLVGKVGSSGVNWVIISGNIGISDWNVFQIRYDNLLNLDSLFSSPKGILTYQLQGCIGKWIFINGSQAATLCHGSRYFCILLIWTRIRGIVFRFTQKLRNEKNLILREILLQRILDWRRRFIPHHYQCWHQYQYQYQHITFSHSQLFFNSIKILLYYEKLFCFFTYLYIIS